MTYTAHEEELDCADGVRRRILIKQDETPEDPLDNIDWCEFVTPKGMRSSYGHKQVDEDWLRPVVENKVPYIHGDEEWGLEDQHPICVLPVGKYEHSGVLLYVGSGPRAGDPSGWDSGQIGWIWMSAKGFKDWSGEDWADTPENRKRVEEALESVIDEYSHYVGGDVWGWQVEKLRPACSHGHIADWEDDDEFTGCWGYIGDWDDCGALDDAREEIKRSIKYRMDRARPTARFGRWWRKLWCRHAWAEWQHATIDGDTADWSGCTKQCGAFRRKERGKRWQKGWLGRLLCWHSWGCDARTVGHSFVFDCSKCGAQKAQL